MIIENYLHCLLFYCCREIRVTSVGGGYPHAFHFSQLPRWYEILIGCLEGTIYPQTKRRGVWNLRITLYCTPNHLGGWKYDCLQKMYNQNAYSFHSCFCLVVYKGSLLHLCRKTTAFTAGKTVAKKRITLRKQSVRDMCHARCN